MGLLIIVTVWASTGWHACIYLANLQVIDKAFYEAADIDGAGGLQKFRYITFPNLAPAMTISILFLLLGSLKAFDLPFALTNGGPGYATTMITQSIITEGVNSNRVGFASAMSILFLILIAVVTLFQVTFSTQARREPGMKKYKLSTLVTEIVMLGICAIFMIPIYYLVVSTFKTQAEIIESPLGLPTSLNLDNYMRALEGLDFFRHFFNSLLITSVSVVLIVMFGSMASYTIARKSNRAHAHLAQLFPDRIHGAAANDDAAAVPDHERICI